jgi:fatty acid desaturase
MTMIDDVIRPRGSRIEVAARRVGARAMFTSRTRAAKPFLGVFARQEDVHCVIYHLFVLLAYATAWLVYRHAKVAGITGSWSFAAFVLAAGFLLGWISGVDVGVNFHNHTHRRIFVKPWLNRWFGRLWTFSGGWPSYFWQHAHVHVHHAHVLEERDWTVPRRRADGRFENIYRYVLLHWPWRYALNLWRDFRSGAAGHHGGQRALKELGIFLALWSIPFWIDPWMALFLWVFPHWIANAVTMASGMYVQHAGCEPRCPERPVGHSNTFRSKFFNLTMFNIGYHVEHHDYPGVHWADLPEFHRHYQGVLKAGGARVVPYGYYRAASIVAMVSDLNGGYIKFTVTDQLPEYRPAGRPSNLQRTRAMVRTVPELTEHTAAPPAPPRRRAVTAERSA